MAICWMVACHSGLSFVFGLKVKFNSLINSDYSNYFEFNITGTNTYTKKGILYDINLGYGDIPSEEIEGPVENVIPVDAKIPGCAVRPQDVLAGVVASLPHLLNAD